MTEDSRQAETGQESSRYLTCDGLIFDRVSGSVEVEGRTVSLRPKPARLLTALMSADGCLLSKDDLVRVVWDDMAVSDAVLTTAIKELRQTLGDPAREPQYIETLHRRGYRFLKPVHARETVETETVALPEASVRRIGLLAGVTVFAALLIVPALVWAVWPRSPDTPRPDASLSLDIASLDAFGDYDWIAPLSAALPHALAEQGAVAAAPDSAEFIASFMPHAEDDGAIIDIYLTHRVSGRPVLSIPVPDPDGPATQVSDRIALRVSHAVRCLDSLREDAAPSERVDPVLTGMLLRHCDGTRLPSSAASPDVVTEDILNAYPDSIFAQALHAAMLANRIPAYNQGQANDAIYRDADIARSLAERVLASDPNNRLAHAAIAFALQSDVPITEREAALDAVSGDGWIGSAALVRHGAIYRQTGRIAEAEYIGQLLAARWPAVPSFLVSLSILKDTRGLHGDAQRILDTALPLFPDTIAVQRHSEIRHVFYGDPQAWLDALEAGSISPPPAYRRCFTQFLSVRLGQVTANPLDDCTEIDVTMRARLEALIGNHDEAMRLIRTIDPAARDISILFYYPEFVPLWERAGMWEVARDFGLIDYWRETGTFPDLCHAGDRLETCRRLMTAVSREG